MIDRRKLFWPAALASLVLAATAGIMLGSVPLSAEQVWLGLVGDGDDSAVTIVRRLRLPRVALGALVGSALAVSGAALQGALRNALAEPYLLGVSGGAAVGAVALAMAGLPHPAALPLAAFAGAVVAVGVAISVARAAGRRSDPRVLIMAGVIVGAFANAVIMVLLSGASPGAIRGALWWMMGSLSDADWNQVAWLAAYGAIALAALMYMARDIDVLALGDEAAAGLGLDADRAGRRVYVLASLLAAATVAAAGLIGFVGLVVPHIVRAAGIRRHAPLLLGTALAGAALVIAADVVARTARAPAELPLGAITALIGVPFFLAQLRRIA